MITRDGGIDLASVNRPSSVRRDRTGLTQSSPQAGAPIGLDDRHSARNLRRGPGGAYHRLIATLDEVKLGV